MMARGNGVPLPKDRKPVEFQWKKECIRREVGNKPWPFKSIVPTESGTEIKAFMAIEFEESDRGALVWEIKPWLVVFFYPDSFTPRSFKDWDAS